MPGRFQYKQYSTRRFRVDLHQRMRMYAARQNITIEAAFNRIIERGLWELENEAGLRTEEGGNELH